MSTALLLSPVELIVAPGLQDVVDRFGRTEDVSFSPDGRRLAIAGFGRDRIYVLEVQVRERPEERVALAVQRITELTAAALHDPHGLSFLDDGTLVVANRGGDVVVLPLPPPASRAHSLLVSPAVTIPAAAHGLASPGSVVVAALAPDLHEVLVCNNSGDTVTRHVIDRRARPRVVAGQVALANGLELPDGVAMSADRQWLAVSSHNTHAVLVYRCGPELGPESRPAGVLRGVSYPHGLQFTADTRFLLVADAGEPNLHVFSCPDGDWSGEWTPAATHRLMDESCFQRGRANPQEGGPKGLDIDPTGRVLAVTSEHQPLAVFELRDVLPEGESRHPGRRRAEARIATAEAARTALLRELQRADTAQRTIAAQERQIAQQREVLAEKAREAATLANELGAVRSELAQAQAALAAAHVVVEDRDRQLHAIRASTSWRVTGVARTISQRLRRGRRGPTRRLRVGALLRH